MWRRGSGWDWRTSSRFFNPNTRRKHPASAISRGRAFSAQGSYLVSRKDRLPRRITGAYNEFSARLEWFNAASKNLDVIGNNVANANTVGFKQSQTQFADIFANSLSGGGGSQAGIGVKVASYRSAVRSGQRYRIRQSARYSHQWRWVLSPKRSERHQLFAQRSVSYRQGWIHRQRSGLAPHWLSGEYSRPDQHGRARRSADFEDRPATRPTGQVSALVNLDSRETALRSARIRSSRSDYLSPFDLSAYLRQPGQPEHAVNLFP